MPRFFVNKDCIMGGKATISGADAHHISYSLRMATGDEITLLDGEGASYLCRISYMDGAIVVADVLTKNTACGEGPIEIHLYQAYPKSDKLELIIQKAVELGVHTVIPFESTFCVKRPKADKIDQKRARHEKIAEEAAKQCGRGILPSVRPPISFDAMLKETADFPLALFCYEGEGTRSLRRILEQTPPVSKIAVIIGSEGGFSDKEAEMARAAGLSMTGLGTRILRCETAPSFVLSAISYTYEL